MGKVHKALESIQSDRSAVSTAKDNYEQLKEGASEGFPLSLFKTFSNSMFEDRS